MMTAITIVSYVAAVSAGIIIGAADQQIRTRLAQAGRRAVLRWAARGTDDLMAIADTVQPPRPDPSRQPAESELTPADLAYLGHITAHAGRFSPNVLECGRILADRCRSLGLDVRDPAIGRVILVFLSAGAKMRLDCMAEDITPLRALDCWLDITAAAALDLTDFERSTVTAPPP
jgi:hypothetical protein